MIWFDNDSVINLLFKTWLLHSVRAIIRMSLIYRPTSINRLYSTYITQTPFIKFVNKYINRPLLIQFILYTKLNNIQLFIKVKVLKILIFLGVCSITLLPTSIDLHSIWVNYVLQQHPPPRVKELFASEPISQGNLLITSVTIGERHVSFKATSTTMLATTSSSSSTLTLPLPCLLSHQLPCHHLVPCYHLMPHHDYHSSI